MNKVINCIVIIFSAFGLYKLMVYQYSTINMMSYQNVGGYTRLSKLEKDLQCLTLNIYMEAGVESIEGKLAVGVVTMNRVKSNLFPKDICEVVYQSKQFSWTNDTPQNIRNLKHINRVQYNESYRVAKKILIEKFDIDGLNGVLYYYADYISEPVWAKNMTQVMKIGRHKFLKNS